MSIIGNSSDMYMLNEADVKIGLVTKYRSSEHIAMTDLNMTELHSLTYIMFKHATYLNRRLRAVINFFFYRTILMFGLTTYFICSSAMTPTLPFNAYFTMIFIHVMTPL
jgi:magnesium-transporting ATPase (P-type)